MSAILIEPMSIETTLVLPDSRPLSQEDFIEICRRNPDRHIEQDPNGDIIIMAPSGGETGRKNARVTSYLVHWADQAGGIVLDSSAGFRLPNGATRAPDATWISTTRWEAIPKEEREGFPEMVPEFVVEIVSPSDALTKQQAKMEEYRANGVELGWLIIPKNREIHVYRPQREDVEILAELIEISADTEVLPGFVLDLARIW